MPTSDNFSLDQASKYSINNNNNNNNIMRQNLINVNGKRTMNMPLNLPERPRPSMINFNNVCDRRSCPIGLGYGIKKTTTIPSIDTPSPSTEFSRLDISLAVKASSDETTSFFENPMFGKNEPIKKTLQNNNLNYDSTGIVNPMFNSDFKTTNSEKKLKNNSKTLFFPHIMPQKYVSNNGNKQHKNSESPKRHKMFHCKSFSDNLRFKCGLASKIQILPTVMDSNEPEQSVSNDSSALKGPKSDEEYYSFDEGDNEEKVIKILERSQSNNCISQISESQESGFSEDFNEEKRDYVESVI